MKPPIDITGSPLASCNDAAVPEPTVAAAHWVPAAFSSPVSSVLLVPVSPPNTRVCNSP